MGGGFALVLHPLTSVKSGDEAHMAVVCATLVAIGTLALAGSQWRPIGAALAFLTGGVLLCKPALWPYRVEWGPTPFDLGWDAEGHLYWAIPGACLLLLAVLVVVVRRKKPEPTSG